MKKPEEPREGNQGRGVREVDVPSPDVTSLEDPHLRLLELERQLLEINMRKPEK